MLDPSARASQSGNVKSLVKALTVLEAFRGRERYLSLAEITAITGLDKSAVQRCTRTLCEIGYLEQDPKTRRYALGRRVLDLSYEYLRTNHLIARAAPFLMELRQTTGERIDLTIPDGLDVLYVFCLPSKRESLAAALIGNRTPFYISAGGRAMLSRMNEDEARDILERSDLKARTSKTLTKVEAIMKELRTARKKGYSFQAEEWRLTKMVAAAPVMDTEGRPIAAVHIAGSITDWTPADFERRMGPLAAATAGHISGEQANP